MSLSDCEAEAGKFICHQVTPPSFERIAKFVLPYTMQISDSEQSIESQSIV
jgi:hypothetical protein